MLNSIVASLVIGSSLLFSSPVQPISENEIEIQNAIPVQNIEMLQGRISISNDPGYTFIETIDGQGWAIDFDSDFVIGNNVMIAFDNMGTIDIGDDAIIQVVKIDMGFLNQK